MSNCRFQGVTARVFGLILVLCSAPLFRLQAQDPVGYWGFEGNLNDSVGSNNAQVNQGSPAYVSGRFGQALSVTASDSVVTSLPLTNSICPFTQ